MDLELADYRRSVEQLRSQLSDRDSKIEAAKREKEDSLKTLEQLKKELGECRPPPPLLLVPSLISN